MANFMHWEDDRDEESIAIPDMVVDLAFPSVAAPCRWTTPTIFHQHLSRRAKLVPRVPAARMAEACVFEGGRLGHPGMIACQVTKLPLSRNRSIFSRRVVIGDEESEEAFVQQRLI